MSNQSSSILLVCRLLDNTIRPECTSSSPRTPVYLSRALIVLTMTSPQEETITTNLEARTLELILDLLSIPRDVFHGRSLTTGATASNILALGEAVVLLPFSHSLTSLRSPGPSVSFGLVLPNTGLLTQLSSLACARDDQISRRLPPGYSVAEYGLASTPKIHVFTDRHHASIEKAAAVVGIGRANVLYLPTTGFIEELKVKLNRCKENGEGAVVVLSFGEVNTVRNLICGQGWFLRHRETHWGT